MWKRLRPFGLLAKAVLFTIVIHGVLLVFLLYSFNRTDPVKRGALQPIQAVAVPDPAIEAERVARNLEELNRKREEEARKQKELQREEKEKQEKLETEKKRKADEAKKKQVAEKKRKTDEAKKKLEVDNKRKADEAKKKQVAEKKRKADKAKKKQDAEKKRKAEELKKKQDAEKKRKEKEAKQQRAEELRQQIEKEQRVQTQNDAADALSALVDRIAVAVENNWRRPPASQSGLTVTIRVKVARDGRVISARVTRSSNDPFFDQSAERAVHKASPLPFPTDPKYYEFINEFDFKFSPDK